jgi:hypothetical protein
MAKNMNKSDAFDILKDYKDLMDMKRLILSLYKLDSSERIKRGPFQRHIATELNLTVNPRFYSLFNKAIADLPVKKIKVQGIAHYKGLSSR